MVLADVFDGVLWGAMTLLQLSWVLWILAIVELVRLPEGQFRAAGTEKTTWIVVVAVLHILGAVIWFAAKRSAVKAAVPLAPSGWYPDPEPGAGGLRWWDGVGWSGHHTPPV